MQALVDGKPIDLNNMPPPLSGPGAYSALCSRQINELFLYTKCSLKEY